MNKVCFSWSDIMGYYCYKRIKENIYYRHYSFLELDEFVYFIGKFAGQNNVSFSVDERVSGLPQDILDKYAIFTPFVFNNGIKGFSVDSNISSDYIYDIFLTCVSFNAIRFLDIAYENYKKKVYK